MPGGFASGGSEESEVWASALELIAWVPFMILPRTPSNLADWDSTVYLAIMKRGFIRILGSRQEGGQVSP